MKRNLILLLAIFSSTILYSQQFNTANILMPREILLGVNPILFKKGNIQSGIYFNGGIGLNNRTDLSVRLGVLEGANYFGADVEWLLRRTSRLSLSFLAGVHMANYLGLDGGLIASFPIYRNVQFFSGIDVDYNFEVDTQHYTWVPVGVEVHIKRNMSFILEMDLPMSEWAWNIYGGGLILYL